MEIQKSHEVLRYKSEIDDLKFSITDKDNQMKKLKEEVKTLKIGSSYGSIDAMGSQRTTQPLRDSTKERLNDTELQIQELEKARQHYAEELEKADVKMAQMNSHIRQMENDKSELEEKNKLHRETIEAREREISRLNLLANDGSNIDTISQAYNNEMTKANIQKLNNQIDFLNKKNQELEKELKNKNEILNTSEKYKLDRIQMSEKYNNLKKENSSLMENIQTMEGVIQELKDKVEENSSIMAKKKYVPVADLTNEKNKRIKAEDQIRTLENEIRQYKRAEDISQDQVKKSESDIKTLNKRLEDVVKENLDLNSNLDDRMSEIRRLKNEKDQFKQDSEYYEGRYKQMENNYHTYKKMNEEVSQEKDLTEEERIKFQNKLIKMESELDESQRHCTELRYELERMKKQKEFNETELEEYRTKATKFKNEAEGNTATLSRVQIQSETAQKQVEFIQREKRVIEEELEKRNSKINLLEKEMKELKYELDSSKDSQNIMRSEHKMLSEDLTEALNNLESEKKKLREFERENSEFKHLKSKFEYFEEQIERIVAQKAEVERENAASKNKILELENLLKIKEKVIAESDDKYQELSIKLSESERRGIKDDDKWQVIQQYKDEIDDKQRVINELRIKETENLERNETLQCELKKIRFEIDLEKERANTFKESKEKLEFELKEARRNLSELEEQLNSGRNENIITEQQKNQATMEVSDLNNQIHNLKKDKHNLQDDNSELRKHVENLQLSITKQQSEIAKLESLIQTLERSKEDLVQKLQNVSKERNNDERDKSNYVTEIKDLKKNLVAKDSEIQEMRSSIIELDQRNDMLQSQLDYKTEELYQTQNELEIQNQENTETRQKFTFVAGREEGYERRLQEREKEIEELKKHINNMTKDIHDMKEMDNIKTHDTNQLANDVEILTRENQVVKEQLMKVSEEKEYFKIEYENNQGRYKQMQQNARALEMEKADIETSYKEVCSENQRFKESFDQMNYHNRDSDGRIHSLEKELHGLRMALQTMEEKEQQMILELQQYDHNVSMLTRQLETCQQDVNEAREARDKLLRDQDTQKNLSMREEASQEELHRYIMQLENQRDILHSQNGEMQMELNMQKERRDIDRQKYYELEQVVNNERMQLQYTEQERDALRSENEKLNSTVKKPAPFIMRRSETLNEGEDSSFSMGSSRRSYDTRHNINLNNIMDQLNEGEDKDSQK